MTERSLDVLLQFVADRRRRQAIRYLRNGANGNTTIDDLVNRMNTGESITNDRTSKPGQLANQLYHAHLPKSADHVVFDFDLEDRTVRYQPDIQFETVLDVLHDEPSLAHP